MTAPPAYPRTPYLWPPPAGAGEDRVVPPDEAATWLTSPVVVEEKLDGANVSIWREASGRIDVAPRGGPGAADRAGQLGRLRAWAAERDEALRTLTADGTAVYGEWLWLAHGTTYDALPDWLVVLDLWREGSGLLPLTERDIRVTAAGFVLPPRRFAGVLGSRRALEGLLGPAAYCTSCRAEGLVLRLADGRRCKVVDPAYRRRSDEDWSVRRHNALVGS